MMRRRSLAFVSGAMLGLSGIGTALAADLPPPYEPPAPVVIAQQFSWTGFYLGGDVGYAWVTDSRTITMTTGSGAFSAGGNGFLGGAEAGYNWQTGPAVFGVEADFQGTLASGSINATAGPTITGTAKTPWFGTVRGRVGYAIDRVVLYATGGAVYADRSMNGTVSTVGPFSNSMAYWTWTAGAGIEAAFWGPLSAKLEYLYVGSATGLPAIPTVTGVTGNLNTNIVRAGLNYHF